MSSGLLSTGGLSRREAQIEPRGTAAWLKPMGRSSPTNIHWAWLLETSCGVAEAGLIDCAKVKRKQQKWGEERVPHLVPFSLKADVLTLPWL